jgi:hypothetical protein
LELALLFCQSGGFLVFEFEEVFGAFIELFLKEVFFVDHVVHGFEGVVFE